MAARTQIQGTDKQLWHIDSVHDFPKFLSKTLSEVSSHDRGLSGTIGQRQHEHWSVPTAGRTILPNDPLIVTAAANIILATEATPPSMAAQTQAALSAIYTAGSSGWWYTMSSLGCSQRSRFLQDGNNDADVEHPDVDKDICC